MECMKATGKPPRLLGIEDEDVYKHINVSVVVLFNVFGFQLAFHGLVSEWVAQ